MTTIPSVIEKWALAVSSSDQEQLNALWIGLTPTMQLLAEAWLAKSLQRAVTGEGTDSPLRTFLSQIQDGERRFRGGDELWRLIVLSVLSRPESSDSNVGDTTDFAAQMVRVCRPLLDELADADVESVAFLKLNGNTNDEIAKAKKCTRRTIQRTLKLIREIWENQIEL